MVMQIAVPVWETRISPVFDTARRFTIVEAERGREIGRCELIMDDALAAVKVRRMQKIQVDVLLCGAISDPISKLCEAAGIRVTPWLSGPVDEVLLAFLRDELPHPDYSMPGCRCRTDAPRRHHRRKGKRRGRGDGPFGGKSRTRI